MNSPDPNTAALTVKPLEGPPAVILQQLYEPEVTGSASAQRPQHYADLRHWVDTFLSRPHERLGRSGPVCPFTGASSQSNLVWIASFNGPTHSAAEVTAHLHGLAERFRALEPTEGSHAILKSVLITFPDLIDTGLIDTVQQQLKPHFIANGLMIGQFYPGCSEPGLWNPDFRPLECPIPLIAIRHMVSSDFPFLSYSPETIEIYLRQFAPTLPAQIRRSLAQKFGPSAG